MTDRRRRGRLPIGAGHADVGRIRLRAAEKLDVADDFNAGIARQLRHRMGGGAQGNSLQPRADGLRQICVFLAF